MSNPALIGAISGIIAVIVVFVLVSKKKVRVGEGHKMGVNLTSGLKCPNCGSPFPSTRVPKNFRQFMWGGWSCKSCGEEYDKWLKPIPKKK